MVHASNNKHLIKIFLAFVVPSVSAQLLSAIYTVVDGFFVGWGVGDAGLAAVGLAFPFTVFVTAVGAGIGVGGGALISISMGRGRKKLAERILGAMVVLMAAASVLTAIGFTGVSKPLLSLYEVKDTAVANMSFLYAWILLVGSPAQVFTMGMLGAVRNDGFPRKAMYIMVSAFLVNIVLDWLWVIVFPFGVAGAAVATIVSQLVSAVFLSLHFLSGKSVVRLRKRALRFNAKLSKAIVGMGVSPFGVQVATALTMIMHNWQALAYGGDMGVVAYAVIGYIVPVGVMLEEGIAEGIQPLVSYYHGASLSARRRLTARMGIFFAVAVGLACSLLALALHRVVPGFFSMTGDAAAMAARGLLLSVPMYPFLGVAKVGASYFQSVGNLRNASFLTYGDPFVLLPFFLWTLPYFFGIDGVWMAMPFANAALAGIFMLMWRRESWRRIPLTATWL